MTKEKSTCTTINLIEDVLKIHASEQNAYFVFPTQLSADLWADRVTLISSVRAVATERFIAWDDFKGTSIKNLHQDKKSIPSEMRKIFAAQLISENAGSPFLKSLIVPEYAKVSGGFVKWISSLLPGLDQWKKRFEQANLEKDDEDNDLLQLHEKYTEFLKSHGLFDPAWETPPFKSDGRQYFIFFPEILSDYTEYEEILKSAEDIHTVNFPSKKISEDEKSSVDFFQNVRFELKNLALYLRKLNEEKKISWQEIAVSVPDLDEYGDYLDRELSLYRIPHVMRSSKPLSATGAGSFFSLAAKCVQNNFDYASLQSLLKTSTLPWKNPELISLLLDFGKENNCLVNFEYNGKKIDVWQEALSRGFLSENIAAFYKNLKNSLKKFSNAETFSELRTAYFMFRELFFDMKICSEESDRILSRCISELGLLIDLEEEFSECKVPSPLAYFISYLDDKKYLEQTKALGVQILPYKTAACAPFEAHIVIDASQASLSVVYRNLSFLREDKRKKLFGTNYEDPNVSALFIKLYGMNSTKVPVYFSCSERTLTGYSQPSSNLQEVDRSDFQNFISDSNLMIEKNISDSYALEKNWFKNDSKPFPDFITEIEKSGFDFWKEMQKSSTSRQIKNTQEALKVAAESAIFTDDGKVRISYTSTKNYMECPRLFLMKQISKLQAQDTEAQLVDYFTIGNLYHSILELYCNALKEKKLPLHAENNNLDPKYEVILYEKISEAIEKADTSILAKELVKTSEDSIRKTMKKSVVNFSKLFEGCKIAETESEYSVEISHPDIKSGIFCNGRLDCLLIDDDEYILVDFKSSKAPEKVLADDETDDSDKLPDFQMPFYVYLLKNQYKKNMQKTIKNCCFFTVNDGTEKYVFGEQLFNRIKAVYPKKRTSLVTEEEFEPTMKLFNKKMLETAISLNKADFSLEKKSPEYETCAQCNFNGICRKTFNVSKKS